MKKYKFILASGSPRRKELIGYLSIPFSIEVSHQEEVSESLDPRQYCEDISYIKGKAILDKLHHEENLVVLSCDTIVVFAGKILGKPQDRSDAHAMLSMLSNQTHEVYSSVTFFIKSDGQLKTLKHTEKSLVTFNKISSATLHQYLDTKEPYDKAGSYGIQAHALVFINKVEGIYSSVVGLPINKVTEILECEFGENFRNKFVL
jgi:septum formation protein